MTVTAVVAPLSEQDLAAIRAIPGEWSRAALRRDWDGAVALLTDDAVLLPPDDPMVAGKLAIRAWIETRPAMTGFVAREEQTDGRADLACSRGSFDMAIEPGAPGKPVRIVGKWLTTLRRRSDGRWLISCNAWNADHPATR